jgi:hypothetical protein
MFRAALREMNADRERDARSSTTSPGSWAGAQHDAFWPSQRRG